MTGERVVFTEESDSKRYVKLVAAGEINETLLDALTDYVKRQRKRLGLTPLPPPTMPRIRTAPGEPATDDETACSVPGKLFATFPKSLCTHSVWTWKQHGRVCPSCGTFIVDFGD